MGRELDNSTIRQIDNWEIGKYENGKRLSKAFMLKDMGDIPGNG
jgi:hypothetical protein